MPYTIDTATGLHDRQVAAVQTLQSTLVKAADALTDACSKGPRIPEQLTDAVQKVTAPLTKIVGSPSEVQTYAAASSRDWLKVQNRFQTALLDAVFPSGVTVEVPASAASKKKSKS